MNTLKTENLKSGNKVFFICEGCCVVIKAEIVSTNWVKLDDRYFFDMYIQEDGKKGTLHFLSYKGYESMMKNIYGTFELMIIGSEDEEIPYTFFDDVKTAVEFSNKKLTERIALNNSLLNE